MPRPPLALKLGRRFHVVPLITQRPPLNPVTFFTVRIVPLTSPDRVKREMFRVG